MILAALRVGLRYDEIMRLPVGDVLDIINAESIRTGAHRERQQDDGEFWALMERS